jgi:hypothetical protein
MASFGSTSRTECIPFYEGERLPMQNRYGLWLMAMVAAGALLNAGGPLEAG